MSGRVLTAVVAALPREIKGLVRGLQPNATLRGRGVWLFRRDQTVVAAAGMGAARVSLALQAIRESTEVSEVISIGLAGSCMESVLPGNVLEAGLVIDAQTGERFRTAATDAEAVLVSAGAIASVREKARLGQSYGAAMVDMEAATLARLAAAHGVRFRAVKGISDAHDFELESLARFADSRGQFRTGAFALHTALRPRTWPAAMVLGRNSDLALRALWQSLQGGD